VLFWHPDSWTRSLLNLPELFSVGLFVFVVSFVLILATLYIRREKIKKPRKIREKIGTIIAFSVAIAGAAFFGINALYYGITLQTYPGESLDTSLRAGIVFGAAFLIWFAVKSVLDEFDKFFETTSDNERVEVDIAKRMTQTPAVTPSKEETPVTELSLGMLCRSCVNKLFSFTRGWDAYMRVDPKSPADTTEIKNLSRSLSQDIHEWATAKTEPRDILRDSKSFCGKLDFIAASDNANLIDQVGQEAAKAAVALLEKIAKRIAEENAATRAPDSPITNWKYESLEISVFSVTLKGSFESIGVAHYFKVELNFLGDVSYTLSD